MFSGLSLLEAFEAVASSEDWQEFRSLPPVTSVDVWVVSMGDRNEPYDVRVRRYDELWSRFGNALRLKLLSGEWVADGFCSTLGPRPHQISPRLWKILEFKVGEDEVEGGGFRFISLSISQARPAVATVDHAKKSSLRHQLARWIESQARLSSDPMTTEEVKAAARRAFSDITITNNLFHEAWRAADKPPHFVQKGRPKGKVPDF